MSNFAPRKTITKSALVSKRGLVDRSFELPPIPERSGTEASLPEFSDRLPEYTDRLPDYGAPDPNQDWNHEPDPNNGFGLLSQDLARVQAEDTKIMQKVNAVHRDAFTERYPVQLVHCLRLNMERLQAGLDKRGSFDISNAATWILSPYEIKELAEAAYYLNEIKLTFKDGSND